MAGVERAQALAALSALDERFRPVTLADRQLLPVVAPLASLLPGGGLRRGSTLAVSGPAATSLACALLVEASGQGSWAALVGMPSLGLVAASELGVALDRLALVPHPAPGTWSTVVAALVDAFDVVVLGPTRVRSSDARRLTARARERGAVLVMVADSWPEVPDIGLRTEDARWEGLGIGHGHLRARRIRIEVTGRRDAAQPRSGDLWLPGEDGRISTARRPTTRPGVVPLRSAR